MCESTLLFQEMNKTSKELIIRMNTRKLCELAEETGCVAEVNEQYLMINEYYEEWFFISHYVICDCIGETGRTLTEREVEVGLEPRWISVDEAINIFSRHQEYE